MSGYLLGSIAEIPVPASDPGDPVWHPIQHYFGLTAFGINACTARDAGDALVSEHDESGSGQQEMYIVIAGRVRLTVPGEVVEARAGDVLALRDPALRRSVHALEPGATVLAVGCRPGCFETTWNESHFSGLARHPSLDTDPARP
jgi:hypothetical protein